MELSTKILFGKLLANLRKLLVNITNITCINDLHEIALILEYIQNKKRTCYSNNLPLKSILMEVKNHIINRDDTRHSN